MGLRQKLISSGKESIKSTVINREQSIFFPKEVMV